MTNGTIQFEPNWGMLCSAYETGTWARRFYLDCVSGVVIEVSEVERAELQTLYDEWGEDSAEIPSHLQHAHLVELDDERYHKVPTCKPSELAQLREQFGETVVGPLQRLLWRALDAGDGVWFERILGMESAEQQRWHRFKQAAFQASLMKWMHG